MSSSFVQRATPAQRRTSFGTICVREYEQTIGDSPSCREGAPITLGWSFRENLEIGFEEFEREREPCRRRQSDLILGVQERRDKLVENGVSVPDIIRAENLVLLKKRASRMYPGKNAKEVSKKKCINELNANRKPSSQRSSPSPLQKQLVSQAA